MNLAIVLALAWFAGAVSVVAAQDVPGKAAYDANCKNCHGAKGEGNPVMATMLGVKFRHLGSRQVQAKTDEQLRENAIKGTAKIQKRPTNLSDQQLREILLFVRTLTVR